MTSMKLNLLILSISPTIAFILWCYLKDKYDKEPITVLLKFFILGAFISVIAIILEDFLIDINKYTGYSYLLYMSFVVAALSEEGLKALVLIPNLLREKNFNEKLDGIIYSIFLSLGFATVENVIYILFEESKTAFEVGIARAVISVPAHIMFAITMGYYISKYKFSNKNIKKREYIFMSVLIPVLLHGIFDFIAMIRYKFSFIIFFIYIIFLWEINLDKVDEYSENSRKRFFRKKNKKK